MIDGPFLDLRIRLSHEASHSYLKRRELVDAVPDDLVALPMPKLLEQVDEWRAGLQERMLSGHGHTPA